MTLTSTYQPTLMQKLLRRNYKWWYVIKYNIALANAKISGNLISVLSFVVNTVAILYVWSLSKPAAEIFTYLLIGRIYKAISDNTSSASISSDIFKGSITTSLLRPQPILFYYYCQLIGKRSVANLTQTVAAVVATLISLALFAQLSFSSWPNLLIILTFIPISFTLNHLIGNLLGLSAFFIRDSRDYGRAAEVYVNFHTIIIGYIIPLNLIPGGTFLSFLPTAWVLHHPMQIYLGKYTLIETFYVFLGGIAWCVVLYFLAKLVFWLGLKKHEAVGL